MLSIQPSSHDHKSIWKDHKLLKTQNYLEASTKQDPALGRKACPGKTDNRYPKAEQRMKLDSLDDTDNVFILQKVFLSNLLRPMLDRSSPHIGILEVLDHHSMNFVAEIFYACPTPRQHHRFIVIWQLPLQVSNP